MIHWITTVVKKNIYKQTGDKNRYYADSSCLTYLKKKYEIVLKSCLIFMRTITRKRLVLFY